MSKQHQAPLREVITQITRRKRCLEDTINPDHGIAQSQRKGKGDTRQRVFGGTVEIPARPGQADAGFTRHALHNFWLHLGDRVASEVDGVLDSMIIPSPGAYAT